MAKTHTISTNQTTTVNVEHGKSTLILDAGVTIGVTSADGIQNQLGGGHDKVVYRINGVIETVTPGSESGLNDGGDGNRVVIGSNGRIDAAYGISSTGGDFEVVNSGTITGAQATAILFGGDGFLLDNRGVINGDFAATRSVIITGAGAGTITNAEMAGIGGSIVDQATSTRTTIINDGTILKSDFWTFVADLGGGNDKVVNRGYMTGDLLMGAGNDTIDLRGGSLDGNAYGGIGNDRYFIDEASDVVFEAENEGRDTLVTTTDWKLNNGPTGHFEILKAGGKASIDIFGNDLANSLVGNKGKNVLAGGLGDDTLRGGKGRDVFHFADMEGVDRIRDFENGKDRIDVSSWAAAENFADIKDMLRVKGKDVWIDNGAERIVLLGTEKGEINAADFVF